jgi:hypothetical protein
LTGRLSRCCNRLVCGSQESLSRETHWPGDNSPVSAYAVADNAAELPL